MLLEIRHVTRYRYEALVRESVMEVWMQPQRSSRQRVVSFDLDIEPAAKVFSYADAFGNAVYHFDVPQPHRTLSITARSMVETQPPEPLPVRLDRLEWDRLHSHSLEGDNFDYLRPHGFAQESDMLHAFMAQHGIDDLRQTDPLTAMRELNTAIYEAFEYEAGVTRADSPIDDVLREGRGVCQDFAHVMLAVCRSWGVPARYVSGYLFTDRDEGDRSDPDASHAWVEVFLPSLRWIGFDPTNKTEAGERHVVCAVGRDYSDVPPTRGVYKGDAEGELAVGVTVQRAHTALAEPEFLRTAQHRAPNAARRRLSALAHEQQQQQQQAQ